MGVDLTTYRAKIGTFQHSNGACVETVVCCVPFTRCLKTLGSVLFIGILLLMAGIESNPGPKKYAIKVTGLPDVIDEDTLETFFENTKKQGGGKVTSVALNKEEKIAVIEFEEEEAVFKVLQKRPIRILGTEVGVFTYSADEPVNSNPTAIKVTGLPDVIDEVTLETIFENTRKQGGGKVKSVTLNKQRKTAIIEFEATRAVYRILQKRPITILGTEVGISIYAGNGEPGNANSTKIMVSDLPGVIDEDTLEIIFEDRKRQGGGKVKRVTINKQQKTAIVEFEEPEAVLRVLGKQPIRILGVEVSISVYVEDDEHGKPNPTSIKVTGLPDNIDADLLEMIFENTRKQGGGKVKSVTVNKQKKTAIIDFEEYEAVTRVLQKQPITILGIQVGVSVYDESEFTKLTTIKVTGLPDNIDEDILEMIFENTKKQGGGKVKTVTLEKEKQTAIIDFEESEAVTRVLEKQPIIILGIQVGVSIYDESEDITEITKLTTVKVTELPDNIDEDTLEMIFENTKKQGGGKVKSVTINKEKQTAIIDFEESEAVNRVLQKQPIIILGTQVGVSVYDESEVTQLTTVKVTGLPDNIDEDMLEMIFENTKKQGGGKVKTVTLDEHTHTALIEFEETSAVNIVLSKQPITILGKVVDVSIFRMDNIDSQTHISSDELVEQDESTRIFVSGIPEGATCELLQHFFEDTDSNGAGPVKHIELNTIDMTAIVEFENAEAVGIITRREQLSFLGRSLKILKLDPESFLDVKQKQIFCCVLKKLGLHDKYPEKIKVEDVVSLDPNETLTQATTKLTDMPWMFLRRLITSHSEARDQAVVKQEGSGSEDKTVSLLSDEPSDDISPLDICFVVLQCCDPILKQILYQKLYQCKLSVPFLYKDWKNEFLKPTLALWPLRSLTVEYRETFAPSELKVIEANVLELPTKTVAFARYGRPCYSKSKLINSILSNHGCKTFYNIDCPSGMAPRFVSNGNVEIFWLPNIGDKRDKFPDHMTFLNMRGNLQANFKDNIISFLSQIVDTFIIVIDKRELYTYRTQLESLIIKFPSVMFLIDSSLHKQDVKFTETFQQQVTATKPTLKLKFLCTHKGIVEQNVVDIVSTVVHSISDLLTAYKAQSVEFKIRNSTTSFVQSDEDSPSCTKGRQGAEHIHSIMREEAEPDRWKYLVTPIQCFFSKKLGQLLKQRAREKLIDKTDNVEERIKEIRSMMVRKVSKSLKAFATTLVSSNFNDLELEFFLGWLKIFIEREKRIVYRQMMQKYCCACNMLKEMRLNVNNPLQDIERQIDEINKLELQIDNASFSIDHMFRELGHIYDALIESGLHSNQDNLPELERVAQVFGYCVYKGHQFELIDGESCLMPLNWIKRVFDKIAICTGPKKIMALSVVGLQSSGKSTLLNTMFGSQFAARSGRCTKGVHMQLIPLRQGINNFDLLPFQYVVIIDTDGLRSSQLTDLKHEYDHDNEMATVITGLGDITIMNTMGENIFEIRDIFQVVVHAFLRLKLANKKLDITKNCCFVYQNVTDTCAADSLFNGNDRLLNFLDIITQESARSEGILEINTFNHVIEFDIRSDVWYLKNFWQGNQPMAMVNYEYSERVAEIKKQILLKAISMKDKSYKSIDNFITHMRCLWDGVLTDDFVFSFRNSLEIKAYREMENALQNLSWQFEIVVQKELVDVLANNFAGCSQEHELMSISASTETDLVNFLNENLSKTEKKMNEYFETNIYKDIVIQWKQSQILETLQWKQSQILQTLHGKLQKDIKDKINKICGQRSIEILTTENLLKHEDELCKKSMDVANKYKGKYLTTQQKDDLFEDIWKTFLQNVNISSFQLNTSVQGLQMTFIRNLYEICKSDAFLVTQYLRQYKHLTVKPSFDRLSGSFAFSCINDEDVSFSFSRLSKDVFGLRMNSMTHVKKQVEMLFEEYDGRIGRLDQSNDEITEHHILHLLHELQNGIANILKCTNDFVFKKTFYVKMYVHVTNFAFHIFNEHNKTYHRVHRAQVRLNKYKQQQQISFEAHLNNRQYEDIVAMLLSNVLDVFVREKSQEPIQISVSKFLYSKLPQNKNQVIISILTKLTEKDEFESFLKYIKNPTGCASLWLAELCNNFLFEKESDENYFTLARNIVRDIFRRVRACVEKSLENHKTKQSSLALDTFIELFNACLKMEKLVVPQENFRTLLSQKGSIDNILFLNDAIMKYIAKAEEKLVQEIKGINKYTVRWCGSNPIDLSIKKVWGCTKQCVYCGEPCAKTDEHNHSDHYSIQHRPSCCKGVFHEGTKLASLESCNFAVQSDISHNCMAFGYLCNSPKPGNCSSKEHKFREYKRYVSNWDIPPTSNMYETSQFWLWFVSKYKDQLAKHYEYKVDNIPATWGNIRKEQALKSLSEMYFP